MSLTVCRTLPRGGAAAHLREGEPEINAHARGAECP